MTGLATSGQFLMGASRDSIVNSADWPDVVCKIMQIKQLCPALTCLCMAHPEQHPAS